MEIYYRTYCSYNLLWCREPNRIICWEIPLPTNKGRNISNYTGKTTKKGEKWTEEIKCETVHYTCGDGEKFRVNMVCGGEKI